MAGPDRTFCTLAKEPMRMRTLSRTMLLASGLALIAAGCVREQDYFDVAKDKQAAMAELIEILETIKDETTMKQAKTTLQANAERYADISRRAQALPNPPPAKVQEQFRQNAMLMEATIRRLSIETRRVAQLPGGADFLGQFESTRGLLSAVQK